MHSGGVSCSCLHLLMRVVIQRVQEAGVFISDKETAHIEKGLFVLVGFENEDTKEDIEWITRKILALRVFSDKEGKMNLSVRDVSGSLLLVSQFTLHASTKKGNRPSFIKAAQPPIAIPLYEEFVEMCTAELGSNQIGTGSFGANMKIQLINDGPVTIVMDSKNKE